MTLCHIQKCLDTWHRWFPEARAGRKGAAVRSKRQHPLRRFAPAILAKADNYPLKDPSSASAALAGSFAGLRPALIAQTILPA
jgi:hypothetical protein